MQFDVKVRNRPDNYCRKCATLNLIFTFFMTENVTEMYYVSKKTNCTFLT